MCPKIDEDLNRLLWLGILEPVDTAECGSTPIVTVLKSNGTIRICRDFKATVNSYEDMQHNPLQHREELRAPLTGGRFSSKVD